MLCQFYSGTVFLYICVYVTVLFIIEEEEEEEEEEKQLIPTKKYVAGIHVQAHIHARTLAHNITNTQII